MGNPALLKQRTETVMSETEIETAFDGQDGSERVVMGYSQDGQPIVSYHVLRFAKEALKQLPGEQARIQKAYRYWRIALRLGLIVAIDALLTYGMYYLTLKGGEYPPFESMFMSAGEPPAIEWVGVVIWVTLTSAISFFPAQWLSWILALRRRSTLSSRASDKLGFQPRPELFFHRVELFHIVLTPEELGTTDRHSNQRRRYLALPLKEAS
jgi:hypothetical protein